MHLDKHKKRNHEEKDDIVMGQYNCQNCPYVATLKASMTRHESFYCGKHLDKNRTNHMCLICKKEFKAKKDMERHKLIHVVKEDEEEHVCNICDAKYSRKDNLQKHMKIKHKITEKNDTVASEIGFVMFE